MKHDEGAPQPVTPHDDTSPAGAGGSAGGQGQAAGVVRTRFAPSPTGYMHVGGLRTALFAWLTARQAGGSFILRLEDTDKKREVSGADEHLAKSLKVLGLEWDEGFDIGGPYGPYRQSLRLDRYKKWGQRLIELGRAYADPYTPEEVQAFRDAAQKTKRPFLYRNHRPDAPPQWDGSQPLRFKSDPKAYKWHDEVMGALQTGPEAVDDFILIKTDGFATYNFAHIVDDADMEITHIIRGQEFISSVPNYLNLYEALGIKLPIMATMPHIMAPGGRKKLSKRDGAKDVLEYINEGFLPEALINFIASMGWNDGTTQEIFTREELIKKFSLDRVQKSGSHFDEQRLVWMNGHYIRQLTPTDLLKHAEGFWGTGKQADDSMKKRVLALVQDRLKHFSELPSLTDFFFTAPLPEQVIELYQNPVDKALIKLGSIDETRRLLLAATSMLSSIDFNETAIKDCLNDLLAQLDTKPAILFPIIRIAVSGQRSTPELAGTLLNLGKAESIRRLEKAADDIIKLT